MNEQDKYYEAALEWEARYRNALLWIRAVAGMHYFGGAFEPEHMRSLANLAARALNGDDLPDFEESTVKARKKAAKWAGRLGREMAEQEAGSEDQALLPLLRRGRLVCPGAGSLHGAGPRGPG